MCEALARFFVRLPLPASGTPARRALERPMAIACLAERAPCLPFLMSSSSSRTNSPATVLADLPARAFRRARSSVRFSGMGFPSVKLAQLVLRRLQHLALRLRQAAARAVDEIERIARAHHARRQRLARFAMTRARAMRVPRRRRGSAARCAARRGWR